MSATQILFNSPALHSLKRDQLVKLCKLHSVKANGKNVELIERLKQRALELSPEALAEDAADLSAVGIVAPIASQDETQSIQDEDETMEDAQTIPGGFGEEPAPHYQSAANEDYEMQDVVLTSRFSIPRPSEQWEIVMEDIQEVDEGRAGTMSSKGSLRTLSNGEFGTHTSKASVSSSIKALATSLGIKRVTSKSTTYSQDTDIDKMPSFSPGKIFGSTKARDSLAAHATPYSEIPPSDSLPETDHFKFSTPDASFLEDENLAGDISMGGASPVRSIRLGNNPGGGMKSTIRLVSNPAKAMTKTSTFMSPPRLPVVQTDFDITVGTPNTIRTLNMWPASPRSTLQDPEERLYPKLPVDDGSEDAMPGSIGFSAATPAKTPGKAKASAASLKKGLATPIDEPDMFSPAKPKAMTINAGATPGPSSRPAIPRSAPFLFGSPLPPRQPGSTTKLIDKEGEVVAGVSNAAFDGVAQSVLEEMHRRIADAKAAKGEAPAPTQPLFSFTTTAATATTAAAVAGPDRFTRAHESAFSRMDSIATHYAARRPNKRKSDALGHGRPSGAAARRSSAANARVISAGARKRMVPGGFGDDDDEEEGEEEKEEGAGGARGRDADEDEDAGARRSSKRIKITQGWDVHRGQRVSLAPPMPPEDEQKKAKERDAVRRELDAAKARRRSSRGRPSIGVPPAKAKASRFGFLSSAKSLVKNVWNMGAGSKPKAAPAHAPPSSIPVPKQAPPAPVPAKAPEKGKSDAASKPSTVAAPANSRKASGSQPRPSSMSSTASKLLKPSGSAADAKAGGGTITSTKSSARSRSPIPPFTAPSGTVRSTSTSMSRPESIAETARSRVSSTVASRSTTRTSTVSSMGARTSMTSAASAASSMGTRRSLASTNALAAPGPKSPPETKEQPSVRKRTSSLLAPTASSLAKAAGAVVHRPSNAGRTSGLPAVSEASAKPKRASAAQTTAAAALRAASSPMSPRPARIFSQPLTNLPSSSPASSVVAVAPSLGAAAALLMGGADAGSSPSKIPRPAVLPPKPKQLIARKPRISRSRVIAKLGAQRAAVAQGLGSPGPSGAGATGAGSGARTRSSMGERARRSLGGAKAGRASAGADLRAAAKKRARQSEYIRRRSRAGENGLDD